MTQERTRFIASINQHINKDEISAAEELVNNVPDSVLMPGEEEWIQGRIQYALGNYEECEKLAVSGLRKNPAHYGIYRTLGEAIGELGEIKSAKVCLLGSSLDDYIVNKYFSTEKSSVERSKHAQFSTNIYYDEPSKKLPDIVTFQDFRRDEFATQELRASVPSVLVIPNGKVWFDGHNLCVYDQNDILVKPSTLGNPALIESLRHDITPRAFSGNFGVAVARSSSNYFHWTTDLVPGFHLLDRAQETTGQMSNILVSHQSKKFQLDTFTMTGLDAKSVVSIESEDTTYFCADNIIVPVFQHCMGMGMGSWAMRYLNGIAPARTGGELSLYPKRLYVSRRDGSSRGVENEPELLELLHDYGFTDVTLDGLSLAEQMKLFNACEVIVAPHGAGLTNLAYCSEGTKVIEFFAEFVQPCFRALAYLNGLEYGHFSTTPEHTGDDDPLNKVKNKQVIQHSNFTVSVKDVKDTLHRMAVYPLQDEQLTA